MATPEAQTVLGEALSSEGVIDTADLSAKLVTALGEDPAATGTRWARDGQSPLDALLRFQSESGAFQTDLGSGPVDDYYTTVLAIPASAGRAWPLAGGAE